MSENSSDDENITPVFAFRADDIMKKQREAYEELLKKVEKEDTAKAAEIEENDLLVKIHEKLKKKPRGQRKTSIKAAPKKDEKKAVPVKRFAKTAPKKDEVAPVKRFAKTAPKKDEVAPVRRSTRQRKKSPNEEVNTDAVPKKVEESPINLPAAAKKRLLKIEKENQRERKRINDLNKRILSSCFSSSVDEENMCVDVETEKNISLKISYLSDISKLTVSENEKFSSIISMAADLFKLNVTEIALWLRDESIGLDDTPHSLNVKPWDIIDCIPYKSDDPEKDTNANKVLIKMQSNDSRKKIDLYAHKLEKFQNIMEQYASIRNLPLKDLIFEFDGEKINCSDTPDILDMESGSCVDVKVVGNSLKPTPPSIPYVDLEKEEPVHKMLDICVLD